MKKIIFRAAILASLASLASVTPAFAYGWVQKGSEWYYENRDGDYVTDEWKESGGRQFYLGDDGYMLTDQLVEDGDHVYYVEADGSRAQNCWKEIEDDDGEYYWYYFQSNGRAKESGYLTIDGTKYHFTDYHLDEGWYDGDDGDTYYYGSKDLYKSGWHYIEEDNEDHDEYEPGWYYTDNKGKLVKSQEKKINGYYYAFNDTGLMCDGWVEFDDGDGDIVCKYYRVGNGDRMDGWVYHDGDDYFDAAVEHPEGWYYLRNGRAYSQDYKTTPISDEYGIAKIDGKYYCFDQVGVMQYGIVMGGDGTLYYFGDEDDGAMKTGRVTVTTDDKYDYEGQTMYFNTKGGIGSKGSDFTGVKNNYLYENGEIVESQSGEWELVEVDGKTYVVNENGKVKTSGSFKDDDDVRWKVQKREDGKGYELIEMD